MAMYGWDGRCFEPEVLDQYVTGLELRWMDNCSNNGGVHVLHDGDFIRRVFRDGIVGKIFREHLFYTPSPSGLTKFFSHQPPYHRNGGGYGGAAFDFLDEHQGAMTVVGPWSSRAAVVNMCVEEAKHLQLVDLHNWFSIKVGALVYLMQKYEVQAYLVRGRTKDSLEQGPWVLSLRPDSIVKPCGTNTHCRYSEFEVAYSPTEDLKWLES